VKPAATSRLAAATLDDHPVLATAPLRPGFDRDDLSRYGDASWDLGPAVFRETAGAMSLCISALSRIRRWRGACGSISTHG
jgi:hypothetical protein